MTTGSPDETRPSLANRYPALLLLLAVVAVVLTADLTSKALAFEYVLDFPVHLSRHSEVEPHQIPPHEPVTLVPGVLALKLTTNTGAVFGLGKGGQAVFIGVSLIAIAALGWVFWRSPPTFWLYHVGLGLMLAGALGNLFDRIRFNAVRDLLWLFPGTGLWRWLFNIADVALVAGVAMLLVISWWSERRSPAPETTHG